MLFLNENGVYVRYTRMPDGQEHCDTALWEYVYDWDSLGWGKYQYLYLNDWVVYWVYEWECDRAEIPTQPWQLNQERISCYCASIEKWMGMVRLIITEEEGTYYIKVDPDKIPDSLLLA
ncbi:MAG: hypothetical protein KAU35_07205 [candidate division Zixibacteria bacterium]|nr:hypothetical protein [candidate division Zixibacteria bacterium]